MTRQDCPMARTPRPRPDIEFTEHGLLCTLTPHAPPIATDVLVDGLKGSLIAVALVFNLCAVLDGIDIVLLDHAASRLDSYFLPSIPLAALAMSAWSVGVLLWQSTHRVRVEATFSAVTVSWCLGPLPLRRVHIPMSALVRCEVVSDSRALHLVRAGQPDLLLHDYRAFRQDMRHVAECIQQGRVANEAFWRDLATGNRKALATLDRLTR